MKLDFKWPPLPERGGIDRRVMESKVNELVTKIGKLLQEPGADSGIAIAACGRYISMYHANVWGHRADLATYLQHDTYQCMENDFENTLKRVKALESEKPETIQ